MERAEGRMRARPGGGDAGVREAGEERRRGGGGVLSGRRRRERVDVADGRGEKEKEEEVPDGRTTQVRAEGNSLRGNLQPIVDRGGCRHFRRTTSIHIIIRQAVLLGGLIYPVRAVAVKGPCTGERPRRVAQSS